MIRAARKDDAPALCAIYNHYIRGSHATFREEPVSASEMAELIETLGAIWPWLICLRGGDVLGYAYAKRWQPRSAYRYAVEASVYVAPGAEGQGVGTGLYRELLSRLRQAGVHTVIGGIALPNDASVALHEKLGFEKVGQLKEVGWKQRRWIDVGYWQLVFPQAG